MRKRNSFVPIAPSKIHQDGLSLIGGLIKEDIFVRILQNLAPPDIANVALTCRKLARLCKSEKVWSYKLDRLDWKGPVLTINSNSNFTTSIITPNNSNGNGNSNNSNSNNLAFKPKHRSTQSYPSKKSDFDLSINTNVPLANNNNNHKPSPQDLLLFDEDDPSWYVSPTSIRRNNNSNTTTTTTTTTTSKAKNLLTDSPISPGSRRQSLSSFPLSHTSNSAYERFKTCYSSLMPYYISFKYYSTDSLLFTTSSTNIDNVQRAYHLHNLSHLLLPDLCPTPPFPESVINQITQNFHAAYKEFESSQLSEFEWADRCEDSDGMHKAAQVLWALNQGQSLIPLYLEKREFYQSQSHNPKKNLVISQDPSHAQGLEFTALGNFVNDIVSMFSKECTIILRVFPEPVPVLIKYAQKVCDDILATYISQLLDLARNLPKPLFLLATVASFTESMRIAETLLTIKEKEGNKKTQQHYGKGQELDISTNLAHDVVYGMFEQFMPEYLQEEQDFAKDALESISAEANPANISCADASDPTFLSSQNPAMVKRNMLSNFTKALLLPVTVVPKAASFSFNYVANAGTSAFNAVAQVGTSIGSGIAGASSQATPAGYSNRLVSIDEEERTRPRSLDLIDTVNDDDDYFGSSITTTSTVPNTNININTNTNTNTSDNYNRSSTSTRPSTNLTNHVLSSSSSSPSPSSSAAAATRRPLSMSAAGASSSTSSLEINRSVSPSMTFERLPNLLSLEASLTLIQTDRDILKRIQTFAKYPGSCGISVRKAMENVFNILISCIINEQIVPAFELAGSQMSSWDPGNHIDEEQKKMAPLVQFFELVHIGDTIQQMIQVFFDREMGVYIDRRDFLNSVVREKRRFETALDDSVAQGLNEGVNALMNQVDHLLYTHQDALDFCPNHESIELNPTKACKSAISCLETHCRMMKGSTDRQILDVFYRELGIRLHGLIIKHLKRSIISKAGGFQVISDVNAYTTFISTLHQSDLHSYFAALKMVANVYIVENPKDLAALLRDATRFEGTLRTEDAYELLQRRTDWKLIEKQVDRHLYGLSTEDCIIQ